ncbi:MAG: Na+/H+ antiporter subunit E [Chloroflexota bacterium]
MFQLNLLLTIAWMALIGEFTLESFLEGFIVTFIVVGLSNVYSRDARTGYFVRFIKTWKVIFGFIIEVMKASLRVAAIVVNPRLNIRPAVIAVPLDIEGDGQITMFANMITLTPGTLSLDVSNDKKTLYVHAIDVDDVEAFRAELKNGFEAQVREVTEWEK